MTTTLEPNAQLDNLPFCNKLSPPLDWSDEPYGFEAGDANLYRYVGNSPTTAIDPTGERINNPAIDPGDLPPDPPRATPPVAVPVGPGIPPLIINPGLPAQPPAGGQAPPWQPPKEDPFPTKDWPERWFWPKKNGIPTPPPKKMPNGYCPLV